ncbi:hypothetical protein [Rossellomorea marisflavi]|uniref:hypothetical protein n=1 Tax=Rossellomorea marisflavi TaxID=189381 RepID=UPI003F9EF53A
MLKKLFEEIKWYIKSDVEVKYETCWYDRVEKIDGYKFYTKKPFSKSYQYHATLGLESTYNILNLIQKTIKTKRKAAHIQVSGGLGRENVFIWKGSLQKAEIQMLDMIKKIQKQY